VGGELGLSYESFGCAAVSDRLDHLALEIRPIA